MLDGMKRRLLYLELWPAAEAVDMFRIWGGMGDIDHQLIYLAVQRSEGDLGCCAGVKVR